jgi:hypothetical protein
MSDFDQDFSCLQINNNTALAVKAIIQDFGHDDDESSNLTSFSTSSPSLPTSSQKIELHIGAWAKMAEKPVTAVKEGLDKTTTILKYFIEVATSNGLASTPAVATLMTAMDAAQKGLDPTNTTPIAWSCKISQHTRAHTPSYTFQLKEFILNGFPLFNIFDAMSLIYTLCIEDLFAARECELHLYQFRFIILAFHKNLWMNSTFLPTTAAATWHQSEVGKPFAIAFATTCVGRSATRQQMNTARRVFCNSILTLVTESELELCPRKSCPNYPGNCPEFVTWGMICRNEGQYNSLCLSVTKEETYKYCGQWEAMSNIAASTKKIMINDTWSTSTLVRSKAVVKSVYTSCKMKGIREILDEGRGRRVKR